VVQTGRTKWWQWNIWDPVLKSCSPHHWNSCFSWTRICHSYKFCHGNPRRKSAIMIRSWRYRYKYIKTWTLQIHSRNKHGDIIHSLPLWSLVATGTVMWLAPVTTVFEPTCEWPNVAMGIETSSAGMLLLWIWRVTCHDRGISLMWHVPIATVIGPAYPWPSIVTCIMTFSAHCYCEFEAPRTMIKMSLWIGRLRRLHKPEQWYSLLINNPLSSSDQQWLPTTTTSRASRTSIQRRSQWWSRRGIGFLVTTVMNPPPARWQMTRFATKGT
jgi:hypothetical protein